MVSIPPLAQHELESHAFFYRQGGRDVYDVVMNLEKLDSILPTPPPEARTKIVGNNRKFHPPHAEAIKDYLYKEEDWVLGTILLGIDPKYVRFDPYEIGGSPSEILGRLRVALVGGMSSIEILDGQHRRMAIRLVLRKLVSEISALDGSNRNSKMVDQSQQLRLIDKLESLKQMSIPVSVYAEPDVRNRSRMFAELAKTRSIDAITKARFDDRDPFNRAAMELEEYGTNLLRNRVEMENSTPPRGSDNLVSLNQLSRCLAILRYGYGSRISRIRFQESVRDYNQIVDLGLTWVDEFLPNAREEYESLCSIELEDGYLAASRSDCLAYSVTVIQLLAGCFHEWSQQNRDWRELAAWLRDADFELGSEYCVFLQSGMLVPGYSTLVSRRQNVQDTIDYIVEHAQMANS